MKKPLYENEYCEVVGLRATCNACDRIIFEDESLNDYIESGGYCKECDQEREPKATKSTFGQFVKTLCFLLICCPAFTQSHVKIDSAGNYYQVKPLPTKTGLTYTDRLGIVYPVYESLKGKRFIYRIAKSGNTYTYYLPTPETAKLN